MQNLIFKNENTLKVIYQNERVKDLSIPLLKEIS
jgi:hypothetical protein